VAEEAKRKWLVCATGKVSRKGENVICVICSIWRRNYEMWKYEKYVIAISNISVMWLCNNEMCIEI